MVWLLTIKSNNINVVSFLNITRKKIAGDFGTNTRTLDNLEIESKGYIGLELDISIFFNNLRMYSIISQNYNKTNIEGFTGTQLSFGIDVKGDFLELRWEP